MRRLALACILALAPAAALAADLPTKANPLLFAPYNGAGMYFGLEAGGGASSANVSGPGVNPASLVSAQGLAGIVIGYSTPMANGQRYGFLEGDFGMNNINGNSQGFSLSGPVTIQLIGGFGAPASQIMSFLPTFGLSVPTLPALPGGATVSDQNIYLAAGLDVSDVSANYGAANNQVWQFAPLIAIGIEGKVSTGGTIGARAEMVRQMDGTCVGAICRDAATLGRAKVIYKF